MKETLRDLFRQKFNYNEYRKVILQNLLHAQELMREPEFLEETNDGDRIYGLGYLRDADGKEIGLYYTNVTKGDVRHKRVGFRKMMKKYTDFGVDAAITVFADKEHWRLSYMCDLKGGVTAAKRFSYIMGDGGMYVTPVNRLSELAGKRIKLEDIHDAFSVEALSDEFFKAYHDHYDIIVAALARQGKTGAIYHDYVKKMMGRIVFLHFLQKKGWLNGNPTFLRDLFFFSPHKDDFLDQVLEPLFFGIFNTEKGQREKLFASEHWDKNLLKEWESMPYLNGGLFERDEIDKMNIKLPASLFDDLFSFLASYNFTVDENDPDDAEIGVDPEMLGKIFESLLEDNKAKGAFYTPKEIVRYMCKESLIAHLASKLPNVSEQVIRNFVETHDMQAELEPYRDTLGNALRDVKICDPAIGSGAFPMGLLNELWRCREALGTELSRLHLKKEIIENNIYGVDIERGAIDIARLRFWLSIVVDSDKAEPLPNFDYKFMQGNSLIESYGGFDLSRIAGKTVGRPSTSTQLVIGLDSDLSRKNLQRLLRDYFSVTDHLKKATMRQAINDEVKRLILNSIGGTPAFLSKLNALDPSANQEFFLWHTWFKDIFDGGGFDIVIANPPYVSVKAISAKDKELYSNRFETGKGRFNLFTLFTELFYELCKEDGCFCLIIPEGIYSNIEYRYTREMLVKKCYLNRICTFTQRVFEASVDTTILSVFKKCKKNKSILIDVDTKPTNIKMSQADISTIPYYLMPVKLEGDNKKIIEKLLLSDQYDRIGEIMEIQQGIIYTGQSKEDIFADYIKDHTYKPILDGRDITKWRINWDIKEYDKYLSYTNKLHRPREERLFLAAEKILMPRRATKITATIDYHQFYALNTAYICLNKSDKYKIEFILGLFNSKLIDYFYSSLFMGWQITIPALEIIPIPRVTNDEQERICSVVKSAISSKSNNPYFNTFELEAEIDHVVYQLYGLTPEEIAVIERSN